MAQSRGTSVAFPTAWPRGQQECCHGHMGRGEGTELYGMRDLLWRILVVVTVLDRDLLSILSPDWQSGSEDPLLRAGDPKYESQ